MNKIEGYSVYQKNYESLQKVETSKKTESKKSVQEDVAATYEHTSETQGVRSQSVELSDKAKDLLKELQKKYSNMDIMVADVDSDQEASEIMSRGTKEYSVLIDPEELEKMANDEDYKNSQLSALESATDSLDDLKSQLEEALGTDSDQVARIGITIDSDGNQKYFAYLEQLSDAQDARIEKAKETSKEAKEAQEADREEDKEVKAQEELTEGSQFDQLASEDTVEVKYARHAFLTADSEVDLLESVTGFDWENYTDMFLPIRIQKLDLSV